MPLKFFTLNIILGILIVGLTLLLSSCTFQDNTVANKSIQAACASATAALEQANRNFTRLSDAQISAIATTKANIFDPVCGAKDEPTLNEIVFHQLISATKIFQDARKQEVSE